MVNIAVAFIAGIAAFHCFRYFPITLSALFFGMVYCMVIRCRNIRTRGFLLLVFSFALYYSHSRMIVLPLVSIPSEEVHITGNVSGVPEMTHGNLTFTLEKVSIDGIEIDGKVNLVMLRDLFGKEISSFMFAPGDTIGAFARIKEPRSYMNPGRYAANVNRQEVRATGYIKQLKVVSGSTGFMNWVHKKRQRLGRIIENSLSQESASLIQAIVPGLKRGIGQEMRDQFNTTGLAHLLSISGTHFGLLAFITFALIRGLINCLPSRILVRMTIVVTPTQAAVLVALPVLFSYTCISGATIPTVRSFIMVTIYMLALFLGRKDQWTNSLAIAALVILAWQPHALLDLSFQLSFAAVLTIGTVMEKRNETNVQRLQLSATSHDGRRMNARFWIASKVILWVKNVILMTMAAIAGTAPFIVMYFNSFSVIAPLSNLIITPVICFLILPLSFISGFISLVFDLQSLPLAPVLDRIALLSFRLVKALSQIPSAAVSAHSPTIAEIICYYMALIIMYKFKSHIRLKGIPILLVLLLYLVRPYVLNDEFSITFLDVGQGESTVVQLPGKKVMLIDGGTEKPDSGRMVIAPFLRSKGLRTIDYVVISHAHPDHYGGLKYIIDNFNTREIWTNGHFQNLFPVLSHNREENIFKVRPLMRGDMLEHEEYRITVLHPYKSFHASSPRGDFSDENSSSLVLKLEASGVSVLFTGDIEEEAEADLIRLDEWLRSDIVKVPHHGGKTSSSADFLYAVRPEAGIISAGRHNPFYHPHGSTLYRYEKAGIAIYRTDRDGAVTVNMESGGYKISTFDDSRLKPSKHWRDELRNLRLLFRN